MRGTRRLAGLAVLIVIALAAALPAQAGAKAKLYKFTMKSKLHMDWQWPVNQFNHNQRDSDSFDLLGGSGCGTKPSKARWHLKIQNGGLPAQDLIVDFVFVHTTNPAPLTDAQYSGTPSAEVKIFGRFGKSSIKLTATPTGDIVGPNINPSTSSLKKKHVKKCAL